MKNRGIILVLSAAAIMTILSLATSGCKAPSDEVVKNSIQVVDVETKWVSKHYQPWPPKLILVPSITFRVKNTSAEPLKWVNFNAIFKVAEETENLGDNYLAAIRNEPVLPGELSPPINLKSNFGVEGKSLEAIKNNPFWKTYQVRLFAQYKGSKHVLLGEWQVSRTIDFKEPEPVNPGEEQGPKK
jgi:hypothetical protein